MCITAPSASQQTETYSPAHALSRQTRRLLIYKEMFSRDLTMKPARRFVNFWTKTKKNAMAAISATAVVPMNVPAQAFIPQVASKAFRPKSAHTKECLQKSATR